MSIHKILQTSLPVRRHIDGTQYKLTASQKKKCDELSRKECCNYFQGNCLLLERTDGQYPCVQILSQHICCRWFQNAVLPLDWKLESEIFRDDGYEICENCGAKYKKTNNHMKYCPDCRSEVRRRKKRQYEAKRRANKRV